MRRGLRTIGQNVKALVVFSEGVDMN